MAVAKIKAGMGQVFIAGGTESMSLIPMTGYKLSPSYKANMENLNYHVSMGATAEAVAAKYNISREAAHSGICPCRKDAYWASIAEKTGVGCASATQLRPGASGPAKQSGAGPRD